MARVRLRKGYDLIRGDVRNKSDWKRALKGVHYVYHLAVYQDQRADFSKFFHVNTVGSAHLYEVAVELALPLKRVVIASSQFVYGDGIIDAHTPSPVPLQNSHSREARRRKSTTSSAPTGSPPPSVRSRRISS